MIALCACGVPPLSSTEQDSVIVLPAAHDFGTIPLGQVSPVYGVEIDPSIGFQDDTVDAVTASCPDFSIDAQYLPAEVLSHVRCHDGRADVELPVDVRAELHVPHVVSSGFAHAAAELRRDDRPRRWLAHANRER